MSTFWTSKLLLMIVSQNVLQLPTLKDVLGKKCIAEIIFDIDYCLLTKKRRRFANRIIMFFSAHLSVWKLIDPQKCLNKFTIIFLIFLQATLSGTGVVTHTAPSYEEQRANPALLSRGASGTPGGRSVRDDGYCSASSTPRAFGMLLYSPVIEKMCNWYVSVE